MGERILREEGFEVVSLTDGDTAVKRMADVDPDLVIADVFLPGRSGFELCRHVKTNFRHARVILTAGLLEKFSEEDARLAGCDALLRKPFEASTLLGAVQELLEKSAAGKKDGSALPGGGLDRNSIRAAVTLALDSAMPTMIEELTERVVLALSHRK